LAGLFPELCGVSASVRLIGSVLGWGISMNFLPGPWKKTDPNVDIGFNNYNQVIGPEKMVLCDDLKV